jgi:hypothetical protein
MRALPARPFFAATLALIIGMAGCTASGGSGTDGPRRSANLITRVELEEVSLLDAYQAIQRLRPNWLRPRGGQTAQVVVDGNPQPGRLDVLRQYRAIQLDELRYMSASDATTRYGTGYDGGAILITTRR